MVVDVDIKLFERAAVGDRKAFWQLMLPYRGLIYSVAFGMLKDHEQAQDQLHDILLSAFRSISNVRQPDRFASWLHSLTRNHILDHIRRQQRHRRALVGAQTVLTTVVPVAELIEKEAWLDRMEDALGRLPEPHRIVLTMKYISQYSCREIARILEISESAVKSRLFEARKLLRKLTEEQAGGESKGQNHEMP